LAVQDAPRPTAQEACELAWDFVELYVVGGEMQADIDGHHKREQKEDEREEKTDDKKDEHVVIVNGIVLSLKEQRPSMKVAFHVDIWLAGQFFPCNSKGDGDYHQCVGLKCLQRLQKEGLVFRKYSKHTKGR
jgi:hypothetical protein